MAFTLSREKTNAADGLVTVSTLAVTWSTRSEPAVLASAPFQRQFRPVHGTPSLVCPLLTQATDESPPR